eukprot:767306-Hanusia_phi.AAC.4
MTIVITSGSAKGSSAQIQQYTASTREAVLAGSLSPLPSSGDTYGITPTPLHVMKNDALGIDLGRSLGGQVTSALSCSCAGSSQTHPSNLVCSNSSSCARGTCVCSITLDATAPAQNEILTGETVYFTSASFANSGMVR